MELRIVIDLSEEVKEWLASVISTGEAPAKTSTTRSRSTAATTTEKAAPSITLDELRQKAKDYGKKSPANDAKFKALLEKFEVKNLPSLDESQYEEFNAEIDKLIKKK